MNRVKRLFAVFLVFFLFSCNSPDSSPLPTEINPAEFVTVKTDRDEYSSNEEIKIFITNGFSEAVEYYGSCSLTLCQFLDGEWMCQVKDCNAPKVLIPPESTSELIDNIAGSTNAPFRYQFEYFVPSLDSLFVVYSNDFFVRP